MFGVLNFNDHKRRFKMRDEKNDSTHADKEFSMTVGWLAAAAVAIAGWAGLA
jgi:hypothetical protein